MANKNPTEISLMKGLSVKLDADTLFTLAYLVHTEPHARDKSEYLFLGRGRAYRNTTQSCTTKTLLTAVEAAGSQARSAKQSNGTRS